jgi:phosphocarrier protein FPr
MVGLVFVSHSAKLVEGVKELADQMVQGKVPLAIAGGINDPDNPIGTDPMKVYEAIESVYSDDGVVVLMDLGSALLSAEMALEFLDPTRQENVSLSSAPFVEGALAAAVQASVGGTRQQVLAEARGALAMKVSQLQEEPEASKTDSSNEIVMPEARSETITLTIRNQMGLHARPAAQFVSTANEFVAGIQVTKGDKRANAKSINQVAMLGVRQDEEIQIVATGADADQVLVALKVLVESNFGEPDGNIGSAMTETTAVSSSIEGVLGGIAASPGIAVGPAALFRPHLPAVVKQMIDDPTVEWARFQKAVAVALQEIEALKVQASRQVGAAEAAIFQAHAMFLQDPALVDAVKNRIFSDSVNAEAAWEQEIMAVAAGFRALDNTYMQARAADVEDIGRRVLQQLMGVEPSSLDLEQPSILIAADLSPSDTARLDPAHVMGICVELGGATSHSAILARALGIPAIVGLGNSLWAIGEGDIVAIDGDTGQLWLQPDEGQQKELLKRRSAWQQVQEKAKVASKEAAVTIDGHVVEIVANIGGPNDVAVALDYGAEGVGLFRTEFLFMDRATAPSEDEQFQAYAQVTEAMGQRPLIIRSLDVGGDKPLPYLDLGQETNPFLGWRGIRFCLDRPEIFKPQLRAVLRASAKGNVKLMFPMIGSIGEIQAAKSMLAEGQYDLRQAGIPFDEEMEVGIMIEVPSAVATADLLAAEVDFFSIGTNDLTQYTMAADRGNANVASLVQALQPAVLRMIKQTVDAAHAAGIWVGICGELAGNATATPLLVGLGLDELSMSGPSIPAVKKIIRQLRFSKAQSIAETVLALDSVTIVANYLSQGQF